MILQRLAEHYDRLAASGEADLALPGFSRQLVSFCIVLEQDGGLHSFEDMRRLDGKSLRPKPMLLPGEGKPSGSGLRPCFLWDSPEYLLGFSLDPAKKDRAPKAFAAFREAHLMFESRIASPEFSAVCAFLRNWSPEQMHAHLATLTECATNFGIFRIAAAQSYVHQVSVLPSRPTCEDTEPERSAMCLVSGECGPVARLHEPKIKGVAGAQASGALLVSFNASAFTSYSKDQSYNAPVGVKATFRYTNALNYLLSRRDRRASLGDATVVYWADAADRATEIAMDALSALLGEPVTAEEIPDAAPESQDRIREAALLLSQLRDGTMNASTPAVRDGSRFFILGLSPNASRLSVRLWIEADAAALRQRLALHVQDLAMQGGKHDRPLSIRRILQATGRAYDDKGKLKYDTKAVSPQLAGDLTRSVLLGSPYPQSLLATMVRRLRSDGEVAFARVSAIRAVLVRTRVREEIQWRCLWN